MKQENTKVYKTELTILLNFVKKRSWKDIS